MRVRPVTDMNRLLQHNLDRVAYCDVGVMMGWVVVEVQTPEVPWPVPIKKVSVLLIVVFTCLNAAHLRNIFLCQGHNGESNFGIKM